MMFRFFLVSSLILIGLAVADPSSVILFESVNDGMNEDLSAGDELMTVDVMGSDISSSRGNIDKYSVVYTPVNSVASLVESIFDALGALMPPMSGVDFLSPSSVKHGVINEKTCKMTVDMSSLPENTKFSTTIQNGVVRVAMASSMTVSTDGVTAAEESGTILERNLPPGCGPPFTEEFDRKKKVLTLKFSFQREPLSDEDEARLWTSQGRTEVDREEGFDKDNEGDSVNSIESFANRDSLRRNHGDGTTQMQAEIDRVSRSDISDIDDSNDRVVSVME